MQLYRVRGRHNQEMVQSVVGSVYKKGVVYKGKDDDGRLEKFAMKDVLVA